MDKCVAVAKKVTHNPTYRKGSPIQMKEFC